MRKVTLTAQFEKDVKRAKKRSWDLGKLSEVVRLLGQGDLRDLRDRQYRDHPLKGKYENLRECQLSPDWLLIYHSSMEQILLVRTGTHADLFR
jgi:mRNA interferase YafQ